MDHRTRAVAYEKAMEQLAARYPQDREAAIFYALALNATAVATDKTYAQQLKAAAILEAAFREQPNHPGVGPLPDPQLRLSGHRGEGARRRPALRRGSRPRRRTPSTCRRTSSRAAGTGRTRSVNLGSAGAADNDFDRFHAWDYLVYGHLQLGQDRAARAVLDRILAVEKPSRSTSRRRSRSPRSRLATPWSAVSGPTRGACPSDPRTSRGRVPAGRGDPGLRPRPGAARSGKLAQAREDQAGWRRSATRSWPRSRVLGGPGGHPAAGRPAGSPGRRAHDDALQLIRAAADREDATEKHPVTPGPIVPARELLAELLIELGQPAEALREIEASQQREPNRFRGYYGAARAAELAGDTAKARPSTVGW